LVVIEIVDSLVRLNTTSINSVIILVYSIVVLPKSNISTVTVDERVVELGPGLGPGLLVDHSVFSVRVEVVSYVNQLLLLALMEADVVTVAVSVPT
jgi:hypothetical protein